MDPLLPVHSTPLKRPVWAALIALLTALACGAGEPQTSYAQIQDRAELVAALDSAATAYAADSTVAGVSVAVGVAVGVDSGPVGDGVDGSPGVAVGSPSSWSTVDVSVAVAG